jgi:hypothetical protein
MEFAIRCSREFNIRREVSNWLEERPARFETAGEPVTIASHNRLTVVMTDRDNQVRTWTPHQEGGCEIA